MIEINLYLNVTRLIAGSLILLYASYTDLKTRKASNLLWIILGIIGVVLLIIQLIFVESINLFYIYFIPVMILFVYVLFHYRLLFGGADAKALMALAILVPLEPIILIFPIFSSIMPFSWIIFSNSIVIFLIFPISLFFYNLYKKNLQLPFCFLGYISDINHVKDRYIWPLEKIVDGKRKFSYMPKDFDNTDQYEVFEKLGIKKIWVTPKIPFMIPLLLGFIISFIIGDVLFLFIGKFI